MNTLGALINCIDKYRAKHNKWRIKEATLWAVGFLGGAAGSYLAMRAVHHKTKHKGFMIIMPILAILHIAILVYLGTTGG